MKFGNTIAAGVLSMALNVASGEAEGAEKQGWDVHGGVRILVETGDLAGNLSYPEMFVTAKNGAWTLQAIPDLVDEDDAAHFGGKTNIRAHTLTAAYDFSDNLSVKAGVLPPFGRRLTGSDFDGGMPGIYLGEQLRGQGGIIGVQLTRAAPLDHGYNLVSHVMGGTKDGDLSEFGNPQGPGFHAPIYGAGLEVKKGTDFKAAYNYTSFGQGPAGVSQEEHYAYFMQNHRIESVKLSLFGEVQRVSKDAAGGRVSADTHYAGFVQASGAVKAAFGWRAAAGIADDVPAVEGALTYKRGKVAAQIGGAYVQAEGGGETIANMVLKREF